MSPEPRADEVRTVLITIPDTELGERIGRVLVEERLAACASLVPGVTSVFWWEGAVQQSEEALLILKTTAACCQALEARVMELHPYDVPEVLAFEVRDGHEPYLAWVRGEVRGTES